MATDMRNPPGVTMLRKGDLSAMRLSEESNSLSALNAKPYKTAEPTPRTFFGRGFEDSISNNDVFIGSPSIGVVEDDACCVTLSRPQTTHAMPKVDPIGAPSSLNWAMMHGKGYGISLVQWHNFRSGLHPRTLFGKNKLAAREVPLRLGEKKGYLDRKDVLAIEVLVQAVVVADAVLQQQRRWP